MQHEAPLHPTVFCKWRGRLGVERLEVLLQETIRIAQDDKLLKEKDMVEVVVDTTVQSTAIAFPTDSRLYFKSIKALGRIPKKATRSFRQMLKRRSAVEPTIGHLKSDHRLDATF
jgi:IS5 family transposase